MLYYFIYSLKDHIVLDYFDSADSCISILKDYFQSSDSYFEDPSDVNFLQMRVLYVPLTCSDIYLFILNNFYDSYIYHVDL